MAVMRKYDQASPKEIDELKRLLKATEPIRTTQAAPSLDEQPKPPAPQTIQSTKPHRKRANPDWIFQNIQHVEVKREPLQIDNPVKLLMVLMPELTPYRWQFEELMRTAGYLTTGDYSTKSEISDEAPYKLVMAAANGSGKDMVMIAAFSVWFMLTGERNRVIITSSSFKQLKDQTEPHIKSLCNAANKRLCPPGTKLIHYTQFHFVCPELGSEIRLYATDEAEKAEGYHPFPGGKMALIINEAKSVTADIFDAVSRCTGYSYWLEISSPAGRSGHMYKSAQKAVHYPNPAILGQYYFRRVTALECPHITRGHINEMIYEKGENDPWVQSSIYANFSDYDEPIVITEWIYDKCLNSVVLPQGDDIGIGVDFAGGGDENSVWVRKGNQIIFNYHFHQKDTTIAADLVDLQLSPWKSVAYEFNADNGGIGQNFIDTLKNKGWNIRRRNNQSPAFRTREFLNLGAEMWFHTKRLVERCDVILPKNVSKFREQLTTRYYKGFESTQGKLALESKEDARINGHPSPDRADGYVLCMFSYRPSRGLNIEAPKPNERTLRHTPRPLNTQELIAAYARGEVYPRSGRKLVPGRTSYIGAKI